MDLRTVSQTLNFDTSNLQKNCTHSIRESEILLLRFTNCFHLPYLLHYSLLFFEEGPFDSKLQTISPLAPKHISVHFLKSRPVSYMIGENVLSPK